jgi:hypothetical protein
MLVCVERPTIGTMYLTGEVVLHRIVTAHSLEVKATLFGPEARLHRTSLPTALSRRTHDPSGRISDGCGAPSTSHVGFDLDLAILMTFDRGRFVSLPVTRRLEPASSDRIKPEIVGFNLPNRPILLIFVQPAARSRTLVDIPLHPAATAQASCLTMNPITSRVGCSGILSARPALCFSAAPRGTRAG